MKKICIDARLWGVRHTGIGRYIENLLANLPEIPDTEIVVIVPPDLALEPKLQRFRKYYARHHPYSFQSQLEMLWLLMKIRPVLLHVTHFTIPVLWPGKMIVTIHDLIKHLSRGTATTTHTPVFYWLKFFGYLLLVRLAVSRASHIIVPAEYWKNELIRHYRLSPKKISVIYEASSLEFGQKTNIKQKVSNYIIYTGNAYPHKNLPVLLRAVRLLNGQVNLVVVCSRSVFRQKIQDLADNLDISELVSFKNNISDDELFGLLSNSLAFVTPSLIEGFGLPGLEAMSAGTPVVAAKASCLPEIYEDAALYFDPRSPTDLANLIVKLLKESSLRELLIQKGRIQVKKYSWINTAVQTCKIYQNELH